METVEQFLGRLQVAIALQKAKDKTAEIERLKQQLQRALRLNESLAEALKSYSSKK